MAKYKKHKKKLHPLTKQSLIQLLRKLSTKELKNFLYFLDNPLHNTDPSVYKLFQLLKPFHPKFKIEPDDLEIIYEQLYSDTKNVMKDAKIASRFRALSSRLLSRLKDFLAFQNYREDEAAKYKHLLSALAKKDLGKLFNKTMYQAEEKYQNQKLESAEIYLNLALLEQQRFQHPAFLDQTKFKSILPIVEKSADYLSLYYALSQLKLRVEQLNSNKIFSEESPLKSVADILTVVKSLPETQSLLFQLYIVLNQLLETNGNDTLYHAFLSKFEQNLNQIALVERLTIYHKLTNYCIRKNKLKPIFTKYLFDLYKFGIKHGLIFFNQQIDYLTFHNIVTTTCILKEFDWAERFITAYHQQISPFKMQNDVTRLSWAFWNMYRGDYQAVLKNLSIQFEESNIALNLLARSLYLRAFYEIWQQNKTLDTLSNHCEELRQHSYYFSKYIIHKTVFSSDLRVSYSNLVYFMQKLISLKLQKTQTKKKPDTTTILQELHEKKLVAKKWVEEKINDL